MTEECEFEFHDLPERPKDFIEREFNHPRFLEELAFHEASHFVFDCLIVRTLQSFTEIKYMSICIDQFFEEGWNRVNGLRPDIDIADEDMTDPVLSRFYRFDKTRAAAKILSRLAGYASYPSFIEKTEFYFANPSEDKTKLYYYKLRKANFKRVSDLKNVERYLSYLGIDERQDVLERVESFLELVFEVMEYPSVRESIIIVSDLLKENECKKIEGQELNSAIKKVTELTESVPFIKILERCAKKF
ncbi:MAG: hypothetical protein R2828_10420 [Saprospiraceae bacterium]